MMEYRLVQARWLLGLYPAEDLPEFAGQAMVEGHDGQAILELASFHQPTTYDIPPGLFDKALAEMGFSPLSKVEAALLVAEGIAGRMLSGEIQPDEGADRIWRLNRLADYAVREFGPFRYGLDKVEDYPADREILLSELLDEAESFLEKRGVNKRT